MAEYFARIEKTAARNEKTVILAELLKEATHEEVDKLVYLALGGLRPAFDRLEFNLAEKMILRAMGVKLEEYKQVGDLGALMEGMKPTTQTTNTPLQVGQVYARLTKIAQDSGSGSQERKVTALAQLIKEVERQSAKYIVRMVAGKLRLGFSDKTVLDALSYLETGTKEGSEALTSAFQRRPDAGVLARMVKEQGIDGAVKALDVAMGTPIMPSLAQRLKTPQEMIEKMGKVVVEKKFDGTRVQIHFSRKLAEVKDNGGGQTGMFEAEKPQFWVRTFTRNLDESSAMFPELQGIAGQIKADEVILDSEAVGYDPKTGKLVPFQLTITRKRKHGVTEAQMSVPLRFFVFDIMYKDGKSLIHLPLQERRKILAETIREGEILQVDDYIETESPEVLREYHHRQLLDGLEGAMVKQVDGEYMPGRTGFNWVKFKEAEDSRAKLADTVDGVIMGYYRGRGKRSGFGLGAFLIGIRQTANSMPQILTLAKVGTGITDEIFKELKERLQAIETEQKPEEYVVPKTLEPDVWVEPRIVVEVAADEITQSPTHTAGYALRFPRLVKFRDDKALEQITTKQEIEEMRALNTI